MRAFLLFIALSVLGAIPASGAEVMILQSQRGSAYSDALRGFHTVCREPEQTVVMSDYAEINVERLVREERPRVVVAMGDRALAAARRLREIPVVALLSLDLNVQKYADSVGGVTLMVSPEQYLKVFGSMGVSRVGVLYDPAKTGRYLKRVLQDAKQAGISLVAEAVRTPRDIQGKLEALAGEVDALWVLPDSTVFSTVNMEAFLLFSLRHNVPIVTFNSHYLKYGAAAALDLDYVDMGAQAAEIVKSKLATNGSRKVPTLDPRKALLRTNESVLRKIGSRGR